VIELRNTLHQLQVLSRQLSRNPYGLLRGPERAEEFTAR
jgi:hypothetical protein